MKYGVAKILSGCVLVMLLMVFSTEITAQIAAIAAIDEPEATEASGSNSTGSGRQAPSSKGGSAKKPLPTGKKPKPSTSSKSKRSLPAPSPPPPAVFTGPVLGDRNSFLNFEVASAEKPYYTRAAKASGAKGLVQVEVLVSTDGSVISAKARTGNKELWPEAERAALASKFNRPTADGRPARAMGFLVYRFGPPE